MQAQARVEEQAVQLHDKLEAKRAATHAEKVGLRCPAAKLQPSCPSVAPQLILKRNCHLLYKSHGSVEFSFGQ